MRHRKHKKTLDRDTAHRRALLRNLAGAFYLHGKVKTTMAKAKLLQPFAEKLITIGKRNNQASLRLIVKKTNNEKIAKIIMHHVAPRFLQKKGGYTRILKLGRKSSDGAERVILEMTLQ